MAGKPTACALCSRKCYQGKRGTLTRHKDGKVLYLCHTGVAGVRDCYSEVNNNKQLKLQMVGEKVS